MDEFELIARFFATGAGARDDVVLGIGDDAAILRPRDGTALASTIVCHAAVAAEHHPEGAGALARRTVHAALARLAAHGAEPAWATLALTLPRAEEHWLEGFASGLRAEMRRRGICLVGGDTTRGPLAVTLCMHGFCDPLHAPRAGRARAGDHLLLTVPLADVPPVPRLATGRALAVYASAACDTGDGLAAALERIAQADTIIAPSAAPDPVKVAPVELLCALPAELLETARAAARAPCASDGCSLVEAGSVQSCSASPDG